MSRRLLESITGDSLGRPPEKIMQSYLHIQYIYIYIFIYTQWPGTGWGPSRGVTGGDVYTTDYFDCDFFKVSTWY